MIITILESLTTLTTAYRQGATVEVEDRLAESLIAAGLAIRTLETASLDPPRSETATKKRGKRWKS